jgi:hypothetical protein
MDSGLTSHLMTFRPMREFRAGADQVPQVTSRAMALYLICSVLAPSVQSAALSVFRSATDVAARSIRVDGINLVIHAGLPASDKTYPHRSSRTGWAGASVVMITFKDASASR